MEPITDIPTYLRAHAQELGNRILESYPPLHSIDDPPSPMIGKLLRKPYPAQTLAIMGLVRRWQQARAGAVIAECGTGKTLISLGAIQTHAENRPFTAVAMVPPQLVEKWCREAMLTLPRVRVFIIDGLRTPTSSNSSPRRERSQAAKQTHRARGIADQLERVAPAQDLPLGPQALGFDLLFSGTVRCRPGPRQAWVLLAARLPSRPVRALSGQRRQS